jgi:hypothetical protein
MNKACEINRLTEVVMIWSRKSASSIEWAQVKQQYNQLSSSLGLPFDMLMVSTPAAMTGGSQVYLSLPNEDHLALFKGFDVVPEKALPPAATLSFGHLAAFRERFGWLEEDDTIH